MSKNNLLVKWDSGLRTSTGTDGYYICFARYNFILDANATFREKHFFYDSSISVTLDQVQKSNSLPGIDKMWTRKLITVTETMVQGGDLRKWRERKRF